VGRAVSSYSWTTVSKTVRPTISEPDLSVCPVLSCPSLSVFCDVGALWPNGWTDQDDTWHGGSPRSRPLPHCIRWGPSSPTRRGTAPPQFSAHVRCGQTAEWTTMSLATEICIGPHDFVLEEDPAHPPQKGQSLPSPPIFGPCLLWPNG